MITQVATAAAPGVRRVDTPELIKLTPPAGVTFDLTVHAGGVQTYVAKMPDAAVGVVLDLSTSGTQSSCDTVGPGFLPDQVPGASACGREVPTWLSMPRIGAGLVIERLRRLERHRSRWLLVVRRDERVMTVVADSSSVESARRLALVVARGAEWAPVERDPRLVGCFTHAASSETTCLRSDGAFVNVNATSKRAARNLCRSQEDGRWLGADRTLVLQWLDGRRVSGAYRIDVDLEFLGRRWVKTMPCGTPRVEDPPESTEDPEDRNY